MSFQSAYLTRCQAVSQRNHANMRAWMNSEITFDSTFDSPWSLFSSSHVADCCMGAGVSLRHGFALGTHVHASPHTNWILKACQKFMPTIKYDRCDFMITVGKKALLWLPSLRSSNTVEFWLHISESLLRRCN